jgi:hypothetical protein
MQVIADVKVLISGEAARFPQLLSIDCRPPVSAHNGKFLPYLLDVPLMLRTCAGDEIERRKGFDIKVELWGTDPSVHTRVCTQTKLETFQAF